MFESGLGGVVGRLSDDVPHGVLKDVKKLSSLVSGGEWAWPSRGGDLRRRSKLSTFVFVGDEDFEPCDPRGSGGSGQDGEVVEEAGNLKDLCGGRWLAGLVQGEAIDVDVVSVAGLGIPGDGSFQIDGYLVVCLSANVDPGGHPGGFFVSHHF